MTKVTYAGMTGPQLASAYNALAKARNLKPVKKFRTIADGVKRCEALAAKPLTGKNGNAKKGRTVGGFKPEAQIEVLVAENPRRGVVAKRFDLYKTASTVEEYATQVGDRGLAGRDLKWDVERKYIKVVQPA